MSFLSSALEYLGAVVVAGGGFALIGYQTFKHFGEKWLEAKFAARLQDLRHKHERELEHLRFQINALLDRTTKLNEKEFEVLPEAWSRLHAAFWNAQAFVSPLQSYADLERMTPGQLSEFIAGCKLDSWERQELLTTHKKNDYYQKQIYWHRLSEALDLIREANVYLAKVGIFMLPDVRSAFTSLAEMTYGAINQDRFNHEHDMRPLSNDKIGPFLGDGPAKLLELERTVHARLWPAERGAA